jgi:(1->4)-alpha-D-glucan 1-alpha-D-glucosylmutase
MEDDRVFRLTHEIILGLYAEGILDGVRVDHVDGLADPAAYLDRLKSSLSQRTPDRPPEAPQDGPYIVVEKILGAGETLPASWSAHGTTGYDFMDQVSALQHDPAGQSALDDLWIEISGRVASFETEETAARIEVLQGGFAGQLAACAAAFAEAAQVNIATRDLTAESFRRALVAFISHLRRYRSYATGDRGSLALDPALLDAFAKAKDSVLPDSPSLDFISALLSGDASAPQAIRQVAIRRLNQLTAPVAAKAVEDTAFYRYSRLISRNDVGFDASQFAMSPESFMQSGQRRAAESCEAMLTTATHDHKRGEDVRARLAVISELPDIWREAVLRWMELTSSTRPKSIASDDAYTLFQTLAGCWPLTLDPSDVESLEQFAERIALWRRKSLREAKQRSSWAAPDKGYEESNAEWLHALLRPGESPEFLDSMAKFVARIAPAGAINAIVQAALRCLWPGIPDLYQGSELWDLSLVDPDNRRPVDYGKRQSLLDEQARDWRSGAVKQAVIERLLQWRRANPHLFTRGALESLPTRGKKSRHVLAFRRHAPDCAADVAVMLHVAGPVLAFGNLPSKAWWEDTAVQIGGVWQEAAELFDRTPVYAAPGN